jgi:DNA polymerase-1
LSGDKELIRIYSTDLSIHDELRTDLYGDPKDWSPSDLQKFITKWNVNEQTPEEQVKRILKEQKMRAKNVNFGIVYGITPFGLAEQIEDTPDEARRMLIGWSKRFPQAHEFIERCRMAPLKHQNLVTFFGYRKRFGVVAPETATQIQNEAANFPHQSTAATITLLAGAELQELLAREYDTPIINTVHDSIILEPPDDEETVRAVSKIVQDKLESIPRRWGMNVIPFKAESDIGYRWGALEGIDKFYKAKHAHTPEAA